MDELLYHCLRELSFDGDLGCNVSRLKDFGVDFYSTTESTQSQNFDDSFSAFMWSLIVQHPTVQVGLKPPGVTSEVWIAPQTSAKRKVKAKGEELVEVSPSKLIPIANFKGRPLGELIKEYGDDLRIALEPQAIYAAITGSHIRFPKLSPMVYTALQIITRGRGNGVTVVELGQQSGYDQKTCFYLVKQLTELDLVVKVRKGGVGTHFCIHRHFFERSPSWRAIRDEENEAQESRRTDEKQPTDVADEQGITAYPGFTPIDARHLSSLPLIRARVVKLLQLSRNHIHASSNMLITIGFAHPTKTDRRFFQSRIRELIQQGVIEKVIVPSRRRKFGNAFVKCFRLVSNGDRKMDGETVLPPETDDEKDEVEAGGVKSNVTIHKQIVNLLEDAGMAGMTLQDLSTAMSEFDKRTMELALTRAEKFAPPLHLTDLGVSSLLETSGRERRHRYYTVSSYRALVAKEKLDMVVNEYPDVDLAHAGEFSQSDPTSFYVEQSQLQNHQDSFKDKVNIVKPRKRPLKNPILADGKVKLGRPRKRPIDATEGSTNWTGDNQRVDAENVPSSSKHSTTIVAPMTRATKKRRTDSKIRKPLDSATGDGESNGVAGGSIPNLSKIGYSAGREEKPSETDRALPKNTEESKKRTRLSAPVGIDTRSKKRVRVTENDDMDLTSQYSTRASVADHIATKPVSGDDRSGDSPVQIDPQHHNRQGETLASYYAAVNQPSDGVMNVTDTEATSMVHGTEQIANSDLLTSTTDNATESLSMTESSTLSAPILGKTKDVTVTQNLLAVSGPESFTLADSQSKLVQESLAGSRTKVNVSHLRRENELHRLVVEQGGIVNVHSKEFYAAHKLLIESLIKAGETTSAPVGTTIDKRTVAAAFDSLERRGRIKQLRTTVLTHTSANRPVCIVYLPDTPQEKLNKFLADLSRGAHVAPPQSGSYLKIGEQVEFGSDAMSTRRSTLPLQLLQLEQPGEDLKERWSKNVARANQLFSYDDDTIRNVLLTERTTLAQYYGFIVGKIARVRHLHLSTLDALEKRRDCPGIICHEHKIIDFSYYSQDIALELHCSLISVLSHDEELKNFLDTQQGKQTPVRDLPTQLHSSLQIGRSRARSRFLDMLEVLRSLNLAVPLKQAVSDQPQIRCTHKNGHRGFEPLALNDPTNVPSAVTSIYWQYLPEAPVYLWATSEGSSSLWKRASVTNRDEAVSYWRTLQEACFNTDIAPPPLSEGGLDLSGSHASLGRSLRRTSSWSSDYVFTWHQTRYLKRFVNAQTGRTPLQEDEATCASILRRVAWVTSAPRDRIRSFYSVHHERMILELEKVRRRARKGSKRKAKETTEAKALLARKAAEAKRQREQDWECLISRLHPSPLPAAAALRLKRVRMRFIHATTIQNQEKWENEVSDALREVDITTRSVLRVSDKRNPTQTNSLFPGTLFSAVNFNMEKPVDVLVAQQGPALSDRKSKGKGKHKGESGTYNGERVQGTTQRRHRFSWNHDYDELARDASAIIRARCRASRLDWGAFEQVFPAVPRNTVRQRLTHIREAPGSEAYLKRLEERWHELWMQHRGTPALPDDDPLSLTNFDLAKHIEFLRAHVDKNALSVSLCYAYYHDADKTRRVGFAQSQERLAPTIPSSTDALMDNFEVTEVLPSAPTWDFMWNATVEEGREKRLIQQPFTKFPEEVSTNLKPSPQRVYLAEAALKMVLGTPHERYEAERASSLLLSVGHISVDHAKDNLLSRGVLTKLVRDPQKQKPGRQLKISESNQNAIGGTIPRDTFQDAVSLEELAHEDNSWREWPLLATDGDAAALVQCVSENKVQFMIDTSQAQLARPQLDWNSKKADDDQIETTISIKFDIPMNRPSPSRYSSTELPLDVAVVHTSTATGIQRCCKAQSLNGLVDCERCLENESLTIISTLDEEERLMSRKIIDDVRNAGESGLLKAELRDFVGIRDARLFTTVRRLTDAPVPILFWTGYTSIVLVHSVFLEKWSVVVSESPLTRSFPRRWYDIMGSKVSDYWEAAVRAVVGVVLFRPGITQYEVRWRLRSVYDRQEVNDVLRYLNEENYLRMRCDPTSAETWVVPLDEVEEKRVFWFIGERHWYEV
ncbi:hypothetical protein AX17_000406 [Amanita inopinata Kibby_2008]|nr:hypothetical protein AX17_000406 [Amanita inopinata Kibby_2008]